MRLRDEPVNNGTNKSGSIRIFVIIKERQDVMTCVLGGVLEDYDGPNYHVRSMVILNRDTVDWPKVDNFDFGSGVTNEVEEGKEGESAVGWRGFHLFLVKKTIKRRKKKKEGTKKKRRKKRKKEKKKKRKKKDTQTRGKNVQEQEA